MVTSSAWYLQGSKTAKKSEAVTEAPLSALQSVPEQPAARSEAAEHADAHKRVAAVSKSAAVASAASEAGVLAQQYTISGHDRAAEQTTAAAYARAYTAADAAMQPSGRSTAPQVTPVSAAQTGGHAAVMDPAKVAEDTGRVGKTNKRKRQGPVKPRSARDIFIATKRQQVGHACRHPHVEQFAL